MENINTDRFFDDCRKLRERTEQVYIYGGGIYGQNVQKVLEKRGIQVDGFVVTKGAENQKAGLPIINIQEVIHKNIGLIIGMNPHNARKAKEYLVQNAFDMGRVINGGEYLDKTDKREQTEDIPAMQITTKVGCRIQCRYCPQDLFVNRYFENDKDRVSMMSLRTFETCLTKLPENCVIMFAGMTEPFLNPDCTEMLKMACGSGRRVELYTTLVGTSMDDIEQMLKLPISYVLLHVADRYQYARIPVTEDYLHKLKILADAEKKDGTPFINFCNAQDKPDEKAVQILGENYEVFSSLQDRAGALDDDRLIRRKTPQGKISCTECGQQLNHNVLLPDGTVILCCNDYGMKHVLGNLLQSSYEEIMHGECSSFIKRGMTQDFKADILCRQCSYANLAE